MEEKKKAPPIKKLDVKRETIRVARTGLRAGAPGGPIVVNSYRDASI
jgi:hypothetical protein